VLSNAVAVLDGATDPADSPDRDGAWYAELLAAAFAARLVDQGTDMADLVADSIAMVAGTYGLTPGHSPSSTVSIVRWDEESVEAFALADSPLGISLRTGDVHVVRDDRLVGVMHDIVSEQHELLAAGHRHEPEHGDVVQRARQELRARRNRGGGYWVAEARSAGRLPGRARAVADRRRPGCADHPAMGPPPRSIATASTSTGPRCCPRAGGRRPAPAQGRRAGRSLRSRRRELAASQGPTTTRPPSTCSSAELDRRPSRSTR